MDLQLQGKTALVLASSKGLGKACALTLAREGANVIITARNQDTLDKTAAGIRAMGRGQVLAIAADINDAAAATPLVTTAAGSFHIRDHQSAESYGTEEV